MSTATPRSSRSACSRCRWSSLPPRPTLGLSCQYQKSLSLSTYSFHSVVSATFVFQREPSSSVHSMASFGVLASPLAQKRVIAQSFGSLPATPRVAVAHRCIGLAENCSDLPSPSRPAAVVSTGATPPESLPGHQPSPSPLSKSSTATVGVFGGGTSSGRTHRGVPSSFAYRTNCESNAYPPVEKHAPWCRRKFFSARPAGAGNEPP